MEIVIALAVGVMFGSGIWLILRPRSFQVLSGLMLMSYAVNLFIFIMGRLWVDAAPLTPAGAPPNTSMKWGFNSCKALNSVTSRLNRFEPIQIKGSTPP